MTALPWPRRHLRTWTLLVAASVLLAMNTTLGLAASALDARVLVVAAPAALALLVVSAGGFVAIRGRASFSGFMLAAALAPLALGTIVAPDLSFIASTTSAALCSAVAIGAAGAIGAVDGARLGMPSGGIGAVVASGLAWCALALATRPSLASVFAPLFGTAIASLITRQAPVLGAPGRAREVRDVLGAVVTAAVASVAMTLLLDRASEHPFRRFAVFVDVVGALVTFGIAAAACARAVRANESRESGGLPRSVYRSAARWRDVATLERASLAWSSPGVVVAVGAGLFALAVATFAR